MSVKQKLNRIKQLEKEIELCEAEILEEFGVKESKFILNRTNINHKYDFKDDPFLKDKAIDIIEKEGYRIFKIKKDNKCALWFLNKI